MEQRPQQLEDACSELAEPVQAVDNSLQNFWTILEDAGELSSCENLNGLYQTAVYDELCKDLPDGLLGFWVSCAFLTVLLLILVWWRLERKTWSDMPKVVVLNPAFSLLTAVCPCVYVVTSGFDYFIYSSRVLPILLYRSRCCTRERHG